MLTRCFCDSTTATWQMQEASQVPAVFNIITRCASYALLSWCYCKNTSLTFYTHPFLGGCQNNSAIGTSPDPLSPREGPVCNTTPPPPCCALYLHPFHMTIRRIESEVIVFVINTSFCYGWGHRKCISKKTMQSGKMSKQKQ